jgi:hypothetical protein
VGPISSLDDGEKRKFFTLPGLELRPLGLPARSQSLYRLSYPGSHLHTKNHNNFYSSPNVIRVIKSETKKRERYGADGYTSKEYMNSFESQQR